MVAVAHLQAKQGYHQNLGRRDVSGDAFWMDLGRSRSGTRASPGAHYWLCVIGVTFVPVVRRAV